MKHLLFTSIIVFGYSINGFSQVNCNCLENYKFVHGELLSSRSFKKADRKDRTTVDSLFQSTLTVLENDPERPVYECFTIAAQLVMQIRDNHNTMEVRYHHIDLESMENPELMNTFVESPEYNIFPFYEGNLDSLASVIRNADIKNVEGIYRYGNHTRLLFVREKDLLNGYILETSLKSWSKGELMFRLIPQKNSRYKLIFGHPIHKRLIYNFEKFQDGYLMQTGLYKENGANNNFHKEIDKDKTYYLKEINDSTQYLKIGSFSSSRTGIAKAKSFCDSIAGNLTSKLLLVDLRGNGGGYRTNAKYFNKLLSGYKGRIVMLVNFKTISYAEIFTLKWKGKSNVKIAGIDTAGAIVYGRNYPDKEQSKDGWFLTHFTDMGGQRYKKYENSGIQPDIYLDLSKDWTQQILEKGL